MNWPSVIQSTPGPRSRQEYWSLYCKGICMGIADLIPGVSGGTIALISGIYQQFLNAIQSLNQNALTKLLTLRFKEAFQEIHIRFIVILGLGILTAIFLLARVIHYLLVHQAILTWSFFFGLIAASIPALAKRVEDPCSWRNLTSFIAGTVSAYVVMGLIPVETPEALWFIGLAGFISITAMILPGISGSFLLLILGKYEFITSALKNPFQIDHLIALGAFCVGALLSLISISRLLGHLFNKYPHLITAFLTGLLLGSLRKIWPWKNVVESVVIRGKEKVLQVENFFPEITPEVALGTVIMAFGVIIILIMEHLNESQRT